MSEKKALGKGLGALIGEGRSALGRAGGAGGEGRLRELPLAEIAVNRRQPRRNFAADELEELAASIRALGVVQPVVVRPLQPAAPAAAAGDAGPAPAGQAPAPSASSGHRYELIAGERRLRAAGLAGLEYIPALVRPADEIASLEIALAENVAREDLNSIEEAQAYAALVDEFGLTHGRVAELVGRSRVAVTNLLRLLELPDDVQLMIEQGELSEGHGRALLALPDHGQRRKVARLVASQGLSVRQTEALVKKLNEEAPGGAAPAARPPAGPDFSDLVDELYGLLETPVRIRSGKRGGTIQIAFRSRGELERLVGLLRSLGD
ncbi:MAG: ParB/RepB/Spo0J family partition protein [Actinobacteria bacterium]|nr:ParB/RepB/Spo0J family partition protein [Actinomycetota bacterium]